MKKPFYNSIVWLGFSRMSLSMVRRQTVIWNSSWNHTIHRSSRSKKKQIVMWNAEPIHRLLLPFSVKRSGCMFNATIDITLVFLLWILSHFVLSIHPKLRAERDCHLIPKSWSHYCQTIVNSGALFSCSIRTIWFIWFCILHAKFWITYLGVFGLKRVTCNCMMYNGMGWLTVILLWRIFFFNILKIKLK